MATIMCARIAVLIRSIAKKTARGQMNRKLNFPPERSPIMKISTAAPGTILLDKDGVSWERLYRGAIVTTGDGSKLAWEESSLHLWGDAQNGPFTLAYEDNDAKQLQKIKDVMSAIKTVYDSYKKGDINTDVALYRISRVTGWGETKDALGPTE